MKKKIHPKYNKTTVICSSCSNTFSTGSTLEEITVEICSNCHPFYTGKTKIVDTENLVKKFEERQQSADNDTLKKKREKRAKRSQRTQEISASKAVTLKDMLKQLG